MAHSRIQAPHDKRCAGTTWLLRIVPTASPTPESPESPSPKAIHQDTNPSKTTYTEASSHPTSNIVPETCLHECRGVPAASNEEGNSSNGFYLRAGQRDSQAVLRFVSVARFDAGPHCILIWRTYTNETLPRRRVLDSALSRGLDSNFIICG